MKFWNLGDDQLLAALVAANLTDLEFEIGPEGGVAVYWRRYFLGVWVEFVLGFHDFVPAGQLKPTYSHCDHSAAVCASRGIAEMASIEVPQARAEPATPAP